MSAQTSPLPVQGCPSWCVTAHDPSRGEDDWLHKGEPVDLADGVRAVLCMSVDTDSGEQDGPYVVIGETQHTPQEAERLGMVLSSLGRALPDPAGAA